MTQDDDWSARIARLVAREVRRYRESQQPRMSVQRLADRTAELDMPIPRSVLANLESGRRETVSVAEVLALAAALNVSPIELICPVGFDKETEILPGRMLDPLSAVRWFTGELKLDVTEAATTLRQADRGEQSTTYLVEYHQELISRLRAREAEAARAVSDADAALAIALAAAEAVSGSGADSERAAVLAEAERTATADSERAAAEAHFRVQNLVEWRDFIREPLRQTRAEMRRRGMMLPDVPADIQLDLDEDDR